MEEVDDLLQRKKYITSCNEEVVELAAMEGVIDQLQCKK